MKILLIESVFIYKVVYTQAEIDAIVNEWNALAAKLIAKIINDTQTAILPGAEQ